MGNKAMLRRGGGSKELEWEMTSTERCHRSRTAASFFHRTF